MRSIGIVLAAFLAAFPLFAGRAQAQRVVDLSEAVAAVQPSVVGIMRFQQSRNISAQLIGTGFVLKDGRHIITNSHVVSAPSTRAKATSAAGAKPSKTAYFVLQHSGENGRQTRHRVWLKDEEKAFDLALLELTQDGLTLPGLALASTPKLLPAGRAIFSIGFPIGQALGLFPATHSGIISAITPSRSPQLHISQLDAAFIRAPRYKLYQLDMTAYPGQSGSPLLDAQTREVVGVVNATRIKNEKENVLSQPSGISYAITAQELRAFLLRNNIDP